MNYKSSGFTLAEALIALTIIGVIAAFTLPTVITNYRKNMQVIALKKVYAELQQNLTLLQTENYRNRDLYGTILNKKSSQTVTETAGLFLTSYFRIAKDCKSTAQPCFAQTYTSIDESDIAAFKCSSGYNVILNSGSSICIIPASVKTNDETGETIRRDPAVVYVDINGPDKPNIGGRDLFTFNIYSNFSIDEVTPETVMDGTSEELRNEKFINNCSESALAEGCFGKILNDNWEMNY